MPVSVVALRSSTAAASRVVRAAGLTGAGRIAALFFPDDVPHLQVLGLAVAGNTRGLSLCIVGQGPSAIRSPQRLGEECVYVIGFARNGGRIPSTPWPAVDREAAE